MHHISIISTIYTDVCQSTGINKLTVPLTFELDEKETHNYGRKMQSLKTGEYDLVVP